MFTDASITIKALLCASLAIYSVELRQCLSAGVKALRQRQMSAGSVGDMVLLLFPDLNVAAAMLSLFSLFLMAMGAICIIMSLSKDILFFLKPASVCFILSGWRHCDTLSELMTVCQPGGRFPLQASSCCCRSWFSTSRSWPSWPPTTRSLCTTSSPGRCRASAARGPSSLWVGSSSCCWHCPTACGRGVSPRKTAPASVWEVTLLLMCHRRLGEDHLHKLQS